MERRELRPTDRVKCLRCGKTEVVAKADYWNAVFDEGVITGFLCPDCQTQDEWLEAEVNEALTDFSKAIEVHNIDELLDLFRPLWKEALETIANGEVERGNNMLAEYLERFRKGANALNRYNFDAQLENIGEAYAVLQELGELPRLDG